MTITVKNLVRYPVRIMTNYSAGTCLVLRQYETSTPLTVDEETLGHLMNDGRLRVVTVSEE